VLDGDGISLIIKPAGTFSLQAAAKKSMPHFKLKGTV